MSEAKTGCLDGLNPTKESHDRWPQSAKDAAASGLRLAHLAFSQFPDLPTTGKKRWTLIANGRERDLLHLHSVDLPLIMYRGQAIAQAERWCKNAISP